MRAPGSTKPAACGPGIAVPLLIMLVETLWLTAVFVVYLCAFR